MSDFFAIFQPGIAQWRKQQDLEKQFVVENPSGDPHDGRAHVDLDKGTARITAVRKPAATNASTSDATPDRPDEPAATSTEPGAAPDEPPAPGAPTAPGAPVAPGETGTTHHPSTPGETSAPEDFSPRS